MQDMLNLEQKTPIPVNCHLDYSKIAQEAGLKHEANLLALIRQVVHALIEEINKKPHLVFKLKFTPFRHLWVGYGRAEMVDL